MPLHHRKRKPLRVDGRTNSLLFLPTYFCTKHIHCDYVKMTSCNVRTFLSVFPPFQAVDILFSMEHSNWAREHSLLFGMRINKTDMDNDIMQVERLKMQFYANNKLRQISIVMSLENMLRNEPLLIPWNSIFSFKSRYTQLGCIWKINELLKDCSNNTRE